MRELIRGYAARCLETAHDNGRLGELAGDVAAFSRALIGSPPLRRALVDTGLDARVRRDIVDDLLRAKAASEASALIGAAVRFEAPAEIPTTIATLGHLTEEYAADPDVARFFPEPPAGRSAVRERIRGFAERAFEELDALTEIDEVEDELFRIARLFDANASFLKAVTDINAPFSGRAALLTDLLGARTRPATLALTLYVFRAGRLRDVVGTFDWLVEIAAKERGRRVAEVRSAVDLDDTERARLAMALGRLVDRTVEVRTILDESVIGGMLISVGDLMIDGTVRLRFERLRDLIAPSH